MRAHGLGKRLDIDGVVVLGGSNADRRLPAHLHQRAKGLIAAVAVVAAAYCG